MERIDNEDATTGLVTRRSLGACPSSNGALLQLWIGADYRAFRSSNRRRNQASTFARPVRADGNRVQILVAVPDLFADTGSFLQSAEVDSSVLLLLIRAKQHRKTSLLNSEWDVV